MATPFGKRLRKLRIDHDEILKDVADYLDVSPAYLSAVEIGKRNVPNEWIPKLASRYGLDKAEAHNLAVLADESVTTVKVDLRGVSEKKREAALIVARQFDSIDDETIEEFLRLVKFQERHQKSGGD